MIQEAHTCMGAHTHIYLLTSTLIYIYTPILIHALTFTCAYIHTYTDMHTGMCICTCT